MTTVITVESTYDGQCCTWSLERGERSPMPMSLIFYWVIWTARYIAPFPAGLGGL